jgi:nitroreductase
MLPELYDAIFSRKAIRKFDPTPLGDEVVTEIKTFMDNELVPMNAGIAIQHQIVARKDMRGMLATKAQQYIPVFSEPKEGYAVNVGFTMQQVDLFLSTKGIGSCWQAMPRPGKGLKSAASGEYLIALVIGSPVEPLHRKDRSEFARKTVSQISSIPPGDAVMDDVLEAARLAPSGTNNQPWFFTGDAENSVLHAYCRKANALLKRIFHKMNEISMGIALCHAWLALEHEGKTPEFVVDGAARDHPPKGYSYISSLHFS